MFSHKNTKEALEHKVVISGVLPDVLKEFLKFIYTGVKPNWISLPFELLAVAEKVFP